MSDSNITVHMREAFEVYQPNVGRWTESKHDADIVRVEGNVVSASYLDISKSPLHAGTETTITAASPFEFPYEIAIGAHMSQRTLGQEFSIEVVDTDAPLTASTDIAISSISQATTTLTVNTLNPHGLVPGACIGIYGVNDSRFNYPSLVVASTPTATQFTVTAGPGGNIPSVTAGPFTTGFVYTRSRLGFARNGASMIFENATVTNAAFYVRSESGDVLPSGTAIGNHAVTIATTASVQAINTAGAYAFVPTTEYRFVAQSDRLQWMDAPIDTTAQATARSTRTQVIPNPSKSYKLRFRATNNKGLTVPNAQIVSAAKAGSTTATIVTDVPHGLTTGDVFVAYGVRDQTNFANLATATAVASVVNETTFTAVWGSSATVTSYGGYIARVNGGNLMSALGAIAQVAQSIASTNNILTVTGNTTWAGLVIGDYVNLVGCRDNSTGASLNLDGAYRVRNLATTSLELEPISASISPSLSNFTSVNCGGAIIKRTCLRISFVRVFDYDRLRVEMLARPASDAASAAPVTVQNTPAVTVSSGTVTTVSTVTSVTGLAGGQAAHDAAIAGAPIRIGGRAVTANYTAVASGDVADIVTTTVGAQVMKPYAIPEVGWNANLSLTTTTAQALAAAGGAGLKRHITALQAVNTGTAVDLIILDGATERWRLTLPQNVPVSITFPTELITTANTALNANLSAVGTVRVCAQGYTAP